MQTLKDASVPSSVIHHLSLQATAENRTSGTHILFSVNNPRHDLYKGNMTPTYLAARFPQHGYIRRQTTALSPQLL